MTDEHNETSLKNINRPSLTIWYKRLTGRKGRGLKLEKKEPAKRGKGKKPEKRRKAAKEKFTKTMSLNARRDGLTFQIGENQNLKVMLQNALLVVLESYGPETENRNETTKGVKP